MIATVNKSAYGTNRFQYVQPSPPPTHNGKDSNSSPTLDQSPLTLLVKACSNLDQLINNVERKHLNPMSMAKMDSHFVPTIKRPRMDIIEDSLQPMKHNVTLNGRLDCHKAPESRYRSSTSAFHKTFDDKRNELYACIYEPNVHHFNPFIQQKSILGEPTTLKSHHEPSVEISQSKLNSCDSICGNQACSCKIYFNSPSACAIPSPHKASIKNPYEWSYVASNATQFLPYPMPLYSPFLVPPTPYTTPLPFRPLQSLGKSRHPFEINGDCSNQNSPSDGMSFKINDVTHHPFPFISSYYLRSSTDQREPIFQAPSAITSTASANFVSSNNHSSIKPKLSQYTFCAPPFKPTTNPTQMTTLPKMTPSLTCPPPHSSLTPYSQPNWYMAAETSRLYYDYYYRIWLYNRAINQLVNSNINYSFQEQYPYSAAPYGLNQNLQNWGELNMPHSVSNNFMVDFPSAVAHKDAPHP